MKLTKLDKKEIAERAFKFITDNPENSTRMQFICNVVEWAEQEAFARLELKYKKKYISSYREELDKLYEQKRGELTDEILDYVLDNIKDTVASLRPQTEDFEYEV